MPYQNTNQILVGLPKGRFSRFCEQHLNFIQEHNASNRVHINVKYMKMRDVAFLLKNNHIDYGVLTDEWVREFSIDAFPLQDLKWIKSKIALIGKKENSIKSPRIVTPFPNLAEKYMQKKYKDYSIDHLYGTTEAFVPDLYDYAIDCVETGQTINEYGLYVEDIIYNSTTWLFSNIRNPFWDEIISNIFTKNIIPLSKVS